MLINLDIYLNTCPQFQLTLLNVHRLILASMCLAYKFHTDIPYKNKYIASVGGVTTHELNTLEINLLITIAADKRFCDQQTFKEYTKKLMPELSWDSFRFIHPAPATPTTSSSVTQTASHKPR